MDKIFVCPMPSVWNEIYARLEETRQEAEVPLPPVPRPLILFSWHVTNDVEKMTRWKETVAWAQANGFNSLIPSLSSEQSYTVIRIDDAPFVPPDHYWNYEPRPKATRSEVDSALETLKRNWGQIVGAPLALITRPVKFTGRKYRRLLVLATAGVQPPWGSWHAIRYSGSFTTFRSAINAAIAPLEVDHVDFDPVEGQWPDPPR